MVFRAPLAIHFLIVVKEVWIDLVEEPLLASQCLLHGHERRACDPVDEGTCWPLVRKRQVEELKDLKEAAEPIDEPVFVLFCNASLHKQK